MKTILLTGASGQLGKVVVQTLVTAGYHVIAIGGHKLPEYTFEGVTNYCADLSSSDETDSLFKKISSAHPELQGGVFLAGGYKPGTITSTGEMELNQMLGLNFFTAYFLSRKLFNHMKEQGGGGRIIFIGSLPGQNPASASGSVAYALSKSLLFSYSEIINSSGKSHDIHATVIVPDTMDTEENRKAMPNADPKKFVDPAAVAKVIAGVLRDQQSEKVIQVLSNR